MTDVTTDEAAAGLPSGVELAAALESLLIIAADPLTATDLAEATGCPVDEVTAVLDSLAIEYGAARRGFELRKVADGWRFYSAAHCAEVTGRWVTDGRQARLSQAALETLAVIAYRQPVSRSRIGAIRGVNVDAVVRTLLARGLIEQTAEDPVTGAALYSTTEYFLQRMGLDQLSDLPPIVDLLPDPGDVAEHVDGQSLHLP
jgi:segregation and condensation protein B